MTFNRLKIYLLVFFLFASVLNVNAQCDPMFDPFCEDVDVPLDDWVPAIAVVAAIAGVWFIRRKKPAVV